MEINTMETKKHDLLPGGGSSGDTAGAVVPATLWFHADVSAASASTAGSNDTTFTDMNRFFPAISSLVYFALRS